MSACGSPNRRLGVPAGRRFSIAGFSSVYDCTPSVSAGGEITLTLTPSRAHSLAATLLIARIASVAAAYEPWVGLPSIPAPEAKLITEPPFADSWGCAAVMSRKVG